MSGVDIRVSYIWDRRVGKVYEIDIRANLSEFDI